MKKIFFSFSLLACSFFLGKFLGKSYASSSDDEAATTSSSEEILDEKDEEIEEEIDDEIITLKKNLVISKMNDASIKQFLFLYQKNQNPESETLQFAAQELEPFEKNLESTLSSFEMLITLQNQDDFLCDVTLKLVHQLPFQEEQRWSLYKKAIFLPPLLDPENPGIQFSSCFDLAFDFLKKSNILSEKMDQLIEELLNSYPTESQVLIKNYLIDLEILPDPEETEDENEASENIKK